MKLSAIFKSPRINFSAYQKALQQVLGDAIAHAAFEWLGATVDLIPVWSGASRSTFQPLASAVGFNLSVSPVSDAPDHTTLGLSNATGKLVTDAAKGSFTFEYGTTLRHLIFNEFNTATKLNDPHIFAQLLNPGPYHFQEAGAKAFDQFATTVRLPNPFDSLTVTTLAVR